MYGPIKGELIQFKTQDSLIMEGFLAGPKSAKLCIIFVHEWGGNFYTEPAISLVREISKRGTAIFSINTRGHDIVTTLLRGTDQTRLYGAGGVKLEKFEESELDIAGAINILKRLGFRKFVLCGHSTGCQKVTYYQFRRSDRSVVGLILVAPGDDYNQWKKIILRRNFYKKVRAAKILVAKGEGNRLNFIEDATPKRFLSVTDLKNVEARLFNFDGELREFSNIRVPVLALFGSKEAPKPVGKFLKILEERSNSKFFESHIVKGAAHRFHGYENEVAHLISNFVLKLQ